MSRPVSRRRPWLLGPAIPWLLLVVVVAMLPRLSRASPKAYSSFGREQKLNHSPHERDLMRIWVVYVGQGDGILIQLPTRYNYDAWDDDGSDEATERIDVMIDGGSHAKGDADLMEEFIGRLYPDDVPIIEHAVVTHHDQDHVLGLARLITHDLAWVETIWHNGLVSWKPGGHFPATLPAGQKAVVDPGPGNYSRGMAFYNADDELRETDLINTRAQLASANEADDLQGIYDTLAESVLWLAEYDPSLEFRRAFTGEDFINEVESERRQAVPEVRFELLWPEKPAHRYAGWSETINGNSVTFRLVYGDFEMLFTGDQNEKSEEHFLSELRTAGNTDAIRCDVLKVPHHGSSHNDWQFLKTIGADYVLSVASMGSKGFTSSWKHPSPGVIDTLGGPERFFSTYIHERTLTPAMYKSAEKLQGMIEKDRRTILIETDGEWFRLVEVPNAHENLNEPPSVADVESGDGTRWIRARKGE